MIIALLFILGESIYMIRNLVLGHNEFEIRLKHPRGLEILKVV